MELTDLSKCRWIVLNGANYSLAPWFACASVEVNPEMFWTGPMAQAFAETILVDTCLIGFSRGAMAAIRMAHTNPSRVKYVFAHSPLLAGSRKWLVQCPMEVAITHGDKTPCILGAKKVAMRNWETARHIELGPAPWPEGSKDPVELWMMKLNHQFHNALPLLKDRFPFLWNQPLVEVGGSRGSS